MKNKVIFSLLSVLFLSSCNEEIAEKNAPIEIFLPNAPDGTPRTLPNYTFNSPYILNLSVQIETNQGNTVVSSHTFIPHIIWEYEEFKNGLYEFFYPSVPIEPIIQ